MAVSRQKPRNPHDKLRDRPHHGNLTANIEFLERADMLTGDQNILEIGCGRGGMLNYLIQQGYRAQGVDVDDAMIAQALETHPSLPVQKVDGTTLPFARNSFDVVLSFDVFEHIEDTDAHLSEVARVLKSRGYYLLQSPNKWTNSVFETVRWRSFTKWRDDHCSLHSYSQFKSVLGRHGFTVEYVSVRTVNDYFKAKVRAYLGAPGLWTLAVLNPDRLPMPLRTNFYIKAQART
jgi:cyclopropane fatty-acyl-phospholipid synthase-like methyltransferase